MARKYYPRIFIGLALLVAAHVAWGRLYDHLNRPPAPPDNVHIVDGDRLVLDGMSIHLFGIDAPELAQNCLRGGTVHACGREAKSQLEQLFINPGTVVCEERGTAVDGWLPAICKVDGSDVNGEMVRRGHALAFRDEAFYYTDEEAEARRSERGIWKSEFEPPWEWRAKR